VKTACFWQIRHRHGIYRRFSKCDWDEAYEANKAHANHQRRLAELLRADVWGAIRVADRALNRQCSNTKKLGITIFYFILFYLFILNLLSQWVVDWLINCMITLYTWVGVHPRGPIFPEHHIFNNLIGPTMWFLFFPNSGDAPSYPLYDAYLYHR